jgi:methylenetetrahydrofolate dehydrogenase (NADP+)/methenyltetrahydrofolate cyclohydrolase
MIIDGAAISQRILDEIGNQVRQKKGRPPGLAFILVGDNPASRTYVRMKKQACAKAGILSIDRELPGTLTQMELLAEIKQLNADSAVDGILVQLPLPAHIDSSLIMEAVDPRKDVDGFHPINMGRLLLGETGGYYPCTPQGIVYLLEEAQIPVSGKHVVIVGRSNIVGKPLAAMLMQKAPGCNATVTVAHSYTENLGEICRSADILIAAMGQPKFITKDMVKEGAVVIDVGINRLMQKSGKAAIVGDVDYEHVAPKCSAITPVPGGVGPMTIAMLLANTLKSYNLNI